jgi:Leucine-rich repeat (LRR) protein
LRQKIKEMMNLRIKLRKNQSTIEREKLSDEINSLEILGDAIHKIPDLDHLTQCQHLLLVCPELQALPKLPPQLKILKIKGGQFLLPSGLPQLKSLSLQGLKHQKDAFSSWSLPVSLEVLDLANNDLENLPVNLGQLSNLTRISLDYNQLTDLPSEVYALKGLNHLSLDGNPLSEETKQKLYDHYKIWF